MFAVEVYAAVRHFVFIEGNSRREAARVFGLSRETVLKMCRFSLPPGYTRTKPVTKPKLGALLPVVDASGPPAQGASFRQAPLALPQLGRIGGTRPMPHHSVVAKQLCLGKVALSGGRARFAARWLPYCSDDPDSARKRC